MGPRSPTAGRLPALGLQQKRLARGLRLNYPEASALIACQLHEFIRDGKSVAELMDIGRCILGRNQVLPEVLDLLTELQVCIAVALYAPLVPSATSSTQSLHLSPIQDRVRLDADQNPSELHAEVVLRRSESIPPCPGADAMTRQVEGTFADGSKLVNVHNPIAAQNGDLELALRGTFLPVPSLEVFGTIKESERVTAGLITCAEGEIVINASRPAAVVVVHNTTDRPI